MKNKIIKSTLAASIVAAVASPSVMARQVATAIDDNQTTKQYIGAEHMARVKAESFSGDVRDLPLAIQWMPGDPIKSVPRRIYPNELDTSLRAPINPVSGKGDPLLSRQAEAEGTFNHAVAAGNINMEGIGYTGVNPADPTGTVGKNHYIPIYQRQRWRGVLHLRQGYRQQGLRSYCHVWPGCKPL